MKKRWLYLSLGLMAIAVLAISPTLFIDVKPKISTKPNSTFPTIPVVSGKYFGDCSDNGIRGLHDCWLFSDGLFAHFVGSRVKDGRGSIYTDYITEQLEAGDNVTPSEWEFADIRLFHVDTIPPEIFCFVDLRGLVGVMDGAGTFSREPEAIAGCPEAPVWEPTPWPSK